MKQFNFFIAIALLWITPGTTTAQTIVPINRNQSSNTSFINYVIRTSDYRPALATSAEAVAKAQAAHREEKEELAAKRFQRALETIEKQLAQLTRGYHDELYFLKGFVHEHLNDQAQALSAYENSVRLRPNNPAAIFRHASILYDQGKCDKAMPEFTEVMWRTNVAVEESALRAARCLLQAQNDSQAINILEKALRADPYNVEVAKLLVDTRLRALEQVKDERKKRKLKAKAVNDLNRVVAGNPKDEEATIMLARMLLKDSDPLLDAQNLARAEQLAGGLVKNSGFKDEVAIKLLFDAQIRRRDLEGAEKTLDKGLNNLPHSALLQQARQQLDIEKQALFSDEVEDET